MEGRPQSVDSGILESSVVPVSAAHAQECLAHQKYRAFVVPQAYSVDEHSSVAVYALESVFGKPPVPARLALFLSFSA